MTETSRAAKLVSTAIDGELTARERSDLRTLRASRSGCAELEEHRRPFMQLERAMEIAFGVRQYARRFTDGLRREDGRFQARSERVRTRNEALRRQLEAHPLGPWIGMVKAILKQRVPVDAREDLFQDVALRAVRFKARILDAETPRALVWRMTYNVYLDWRIRQAKSGSEPLDESASGHEPAAAERAVLRRQLREYGERLPCKEREVLMLRLLCGLPHCDIAEQVGLSENASKKCLHRACRRLKAAFAVRELASNLGGLFEQAELRPPVAPGKAVEVFRLRERDALGYADIGVIAGLDRDEVALAMATTRLALVLALGDQLEVFPIGRPIRPPRPADQTADRGAA